MLEGLKRMFRGEGGGRDPSDDFWYQSIGHGSASGVRVTHENVLRLPAVLACVQVISETISTLPLDIFESSHDRAENRRQPGHPLHAILHDQANDEHTAAEWRDMMTAHAVLRGTSYSEIIPGRLGSVSQLRPIFPDYVKPIWVVLPDGRREVQFQISERGLATRRLLRDELFIVRAKIWGENPMLGIDVVHEERELFGAALALQDFAARFFANDAMPSFGIKVPFKFKDEDAKRNFRAAWQRFHTGANRFKVGLFENGTEPVELGRMTNEQAQFIETRNRLDLAIAQVFRVQPHKIGILDRATFSNIEQQSIEHVVDTLRPWLVRWEQAIKRDLIQGSRLYAEHNVAGLLRGDIESRYNAYAVGRNWGWLSANDVRRLENLNPIEQGEEYLRPLNMQPADAPAEPSGQGQPRRPARERPPNGAAVHH